MHCAAAPCLRVCPTGATRREADGAVTIDADACIGCRACMQACPYEARRFLWAFRNYWPDEEPTPYETLARKKFEPGTVAKCDFCRARRAQGRVPGCVEACPTAARVFGDTEDQCSEISRLLSSNDVARLRPELGTEPAVWYRCLPGATP